MSFYSYKNANQNCCPGSIIGDPTQGLKEKVCVMVKKVYDSCLQQEQLENCTITINNACPVDCGGECDSSLPALVPPFAFESCRSSTTKGTLRNVYIERLCDRPNFARIKGIVDISVDILFIDCKGQRGIAQGILSVAKDVLMFIPDESIVPFTLDALVSAICVSGCYIGDGKFRITICVTVILKIIAEVELLVPTYGFCPIPPCEEFSENICDEFFSLPIFPQNPLCTCNMPTGHCICGGH